ncbi:MAG: hypothetical protein Q8K26_01840, partial [Candidatus Gracilibacteria bacterium]|nr:hypothetical protein [Candidatus Gracilibacteria bacterium]
SKYYVDNIKKLNFLRKDGFLEIDLKDLHTADDKVRLLVENAIKLNGMTDLGRAVYIADMFGVSLASDSIRPFIYATMIRPGRGILIDDPDARIYQFGDWKIYGIVPEGGKGILIDTETMEKIELKIKGTNSVITKPGKEFILGGQKVQQVVSDGKYVIISPETLEKLELKIKGTNDVITYISIYGSRQQNIEEVEINNNEDIKKRIYINCETLEKVDKPA